MCNYDVIKCTWRELEFIVVILFKIIFFSENFAIFSNLQKQKKQKPIINSNFKIGDIVDSGSLNYYRIFFLKITNTSFWNDGSIMFLQYKSLEHQPLNIFHI